MAITVEQIRDLREMTGAGVLDAKKALEAAGGKFDQAAQALREKGLARAEKRSGREASEGVIEIYSHPGGRVGVMLELNCETDFVAMNEEFKELAHDLALHVAAMNPQYLGREEVPAQDLESEMQVLRAQAKAEGKPDNIVDKIVEGRLNKFYAETVLLEQPFVKDDSLTVDDLIKNAIAKMGENIILRRYVRYALGEAIE